MIMSAHFGDINELPGLQNGLYNVTKASCGKSKLVSRPRKLFMARAMMTEDCLPL